MALTCPNCESEIPESDWGAEEAVEDGLTDELVVHVTDPEDSVAVERRDYYCDPSCFIAHHD